MTREELIRELEILRVQAITIFQAQAPYRKGNLMRAIRIEPLTAQDGFRIVLDISYAVYTEEEWLSPRWRGRKNPNEKWFKKAFEFVIQYIQNRMGITFVKE